MPRDVILTIPWKETPSRYVKVVFEKKDLIEPKVKQITGKEEFETVRFENGPCGTRIIVKFFDVEAAEGFVEGIRESMTGDEKIKQVKYEFGKLESSATSACPVFFPSSLPLLF